MSKTIPQNTTEGMVKLRQGMMLWELGLNTLWGPSCVLEKTLPNCLMEAGVFVYQLQLGCPRCNKLQHF